MENGYRLIIQGDNSEIYTTLCAYGWRTKDEQTRKHYVNRALENMSTEDDDAFYRIYVDDLLVLADLILLFGGNRFHVGLNCLCEGSEASTEFSLERIRGETHGVVVHQMARIGNDAVRVERAARKALEVLGKALAF